MTSVSGEQYELLHSSQRGSSRAIIRQVAAGLRALWLDGVEAIQSHPDSVLPPMGAGLVLVPWPNRVRDGRWTLKGSVQQLDLTDPGKGNAIHGLLRNTAYTVLGRSDSWVELGATVHPQHGYPFLLETSVRYALDDDGLTVTHWFTNRGDSAAPVAVGAHPFLRAGDATASDLVVTVDAGEVAPAGERGLPGEWRAVDGTMWDLRGGRPVRELDVDACFRAIADEDGRVTHRLTAPDGTGTELWADEVFAFAQVYTPHDFPTETGKAQAIAIEPMTAPPDALNSGEGLRWLDPGSSWTARWGIRSFRV